MQVTQSAISDWERDRRFPRPESIPRLEEVLGLPPGYLLALRTGTTPDAPAPTPRPPVAGFEHLTPEKQDAVISIVRAFLIEQGLDPDNPEPLNPDGTPNHHHDG